MGLALRLALWLMKSIKIPIGTLTKIVEVADLDGDGYIDISEIVAFMLASGKAVREMGKS